MDGTDELSQPGSPGPSVERSVLRPSVSDQGNNITPTPPPRSRSWQLDSLAQVSFAARSSPIGLHSARIKPVPAGNRGYVSPVKPTTPVTRRRTLPHNTKIRERTLSFEDPDSACIFTPPTNKHSASQPNDKHRRQKSDTLPVFPPAHPDESYKPNDPFKLMGTVEDLPPNPKVWSPSQLALFLAHILKLTPAPVIQDLIDIVLRRGLTGRKFLALGLVALPSLSAFACKISTH